MPGDVVASRAGYRGQSSGITGSIKPRTTAIRTLRGRDEVYDGLPRAVPGED